MISLITIHGYLGRDPEIKECQSQSGTFSRVSFSVGVSRDYGDQTDWFNCVMYGKRAEVLHKYFHKGSEIMLLGRPESYKGNDGRTYWSIRVSDFNFCGNSKKQNEEAPEGFVAVSDDDELTDASSDDFNLF